MSETIDAAVSLPKPKIEVFKKIAARTAIASVAVVAAAVVYLKFTDPVSEETVNAETPSA